MDNRSSRPADNKKNDILVHGKGPADELNDNTVTTETKYSFNVIKSKKNICLNIHLYSLYTNTVKI